MNYPARVAVGNYGDCIEESSEQLAQRLGLNVLPANMLAVELCDFVLFYRQGYLYLSQSQDPLISAVCVDFEAEKLSYRQRNSVQPEALLKAAGIKQLSACRVLDATAGLGLDAYIFAAAGCLVTMVERSPVVHALLADGLRRGSESADQRVSQTVARMTLLQGDSREFCIQMSDFKPDVVYLDPMFPQRKKSARVKKQMFIMQQLLHGDPPADGLLANALAIARRRVVVKRPLHADFLEGRKPAFQQLGKSNRFDVYLVSTSPLA